MSRFSIGVDVGGTSIKAAIVDIDRGTLVGEVVSMPTPQPATIVAVTDGIEQLLERLGRGVTQTQSLGIGFPISVLADGTVTGVGLHPTWHGTAVRPIFEQRFGQCAILNDADTASLAELYFGAARAVRGTVLVLTLGTGIGSALLVDGHLVPNLELGIMPWKGATAESRISAISRERLGTGWKEWASEFSDYLDLLYEMFSPELVVLAGGVTDISEQFMPHLSSPVTIVISRNRANTGIIGAALSVRHQRRIRP